jgi:hypothetical protein
MIDPRLVLHPFPVNLRVSAENLVALVKNAGHRLDFGDTFVFFNRKRDRCRIVWRDGRCFSSLEKALQSGTFAPSEKIQIKQSVIDNFVDGGIGGQTELLHALLGNVLYLADARERPLD